MAETRQLSLFGKYVVEKYVYPLLSNFSLILKPPFACIIALQTTDRLKGFYKKLFLFGIIFRKVRNYNTVIEDINFCVNEIPFNTSIVCNDETARTRKRDE